MIIKPVTISIIGSIPTISAIQFYTYSIKSSTTRRMTGRLAIATLCLNVSSTAFLSYNPKILVYK